MKTRIEHWRYDDGNYVIPNFFCTSEMSSSFEFREDVVGWHCWVYTDGVDEFEQWMKDNMTGEYECDFRFNSGDPMHTVRITKDEDATLFKLKWM